jgi:glyoxylase-like metal-dependent hydrolase (beta-lactamase superfamily II)
MVTEIRDRGEILEWRWCTNNKLIPDPYWTSSFLVDGLLVDSGAPASIDEFRTFLGNLTPEQFPTQCFITHAHEDHAGGAKMLLDDFGIPSYASELARKFLLKEFILTPEYRKISWGDIMLSTPTEPIPIPQLITKSDKYHFDYLPMPGHAPCLISLIEKEMQWVFVGDAVIPKRKMLFGNTCNIHEDIHQIYTSTQQLYQITQNMDQLRIFVAGYGEYDGLEFLQDRLKEIEDQHQLAFQLQAEGLPPKKIVRKMFHDESFIASFTHGELSRLNLVLSLLNWPLE